MSILTDIEALLNTADLPNHIGYAPTGVACPYIVSRPLYINAPENAIAGNAIDWEQQVSLYCAGDSVEASYNLAVAAMQALQGKRSFGTTLSTSLGYTGAQVEGHYNSQVTVTLNQGEL